MLLGVPVILSDACGSYGPSDDVQIGHSGLVYPCGDIVALATQILRLAHNESLRNSFGAYGQAYLHESQQRAHHTALRSALCAEGLL